MAVAAKSSGIAVLMFSVIHAPLLANRFSQDRDLLPYTLVQRAQANDDIKKVCDDVVDDEGKAKANPYQQYYEQKITYCGAAINADKAISYLIGTAVGYGIVGALCIVMGAVCLATLSIATAVTLVCTIAITVMGIVDMVWNQVVGSSFHSTATTIGQAVSGGAGLVAGLVSAGLVSSMASSTSSSASNSSSGSSSNCVGAFIAAGIAFIIMAFKIAGEEDARGSRDSNIENAKNFNPAIPNDKNVVNAFTTSGRATKAKTGIVGGHGKGDEGGPEDDSGGRCSAAGESSACVNANGSAATAGFQQLLDDPRTDKAFKAMSGQSVKDFAASASSAGGAFHDAITGGGLVSDDAYGAAMDAARAAAAGDPSMFAGSLGSTFSAGHAGHKGGGRGGKGNDMSDLMAGLMDKLNPKKDDKKEDGRDIDFGARIAGKSADQIFADKSISLFQRIEHRYKTSVAKNAVDDLPWSVQRNQVTAGQKGKVGGK